MNIFKKFKKDTALLRTNNYMKKNYSSSLKFKINYILSDNHLKKYYNF